MHSLVYVELVSVVIRARGRGSESLSTRLRWGMLLRVTGGFAWGAIWLRPLSVAKARAETRLLSVMVQWSATPVWALPSSGWRVSKAWLPTEVLLRPAKTETDCSLWGHLCYDSFWSQIMEIAGSQEAKISQKSCALYPRCPTAPVASLNMGIFSSPDHPHPRDGISHLTVMVTVIADGRGDAQDPARSL